MKTQTSFAELTAAIIAAIDLVNPILKHHHRRTTVIAWHLARALHFTNTQLAELCVAASLHDVGALTTLERNRLVQLDVEDPEPHAILGAKMLEGMPLFGNASEIVRYHHVYYNTNTTAPRASYVLHLADRIEILLNSDEHYSHQVSRIVNTILALTNTQFHPEVVKAFLEIASVDVLWLDIDHMPLDQLITQCLEKTHPIPISLSLLEALAQCFSKIIDYRSPYTAAHSRGVGEVAYHLAKLCDLNTETAIKLKIAGLLHDIGKLGVPSEIIEKKGALNINEYLDVKAHSYYTHLILSEIPAISDIAYLAASHHEKRDGSGYPYHLKNFDLCLETDILSFADLFTALSENRPYRDAMSKEHVLATIEKELVTPENIDLFEKLKANFDTLDGLRERIQASAGEISNITI